MADSALEFQTLDPASLDVEQNYAWMIRAIVPRPIAWISTCNAAGTRNLAPFSYFNGVCSAPPTIAFSVANHADGSQKDTLNNIEALRQFVINVVPARLAEPMHATSAEVGPEIDEFTVAELEAIPSIRVRPPRVALSPVQMECELDRIIRVGQGPFAGNLVLGTIVLLHLRGDVLNERGQIDPALLDAIGRMGGRDYARTRDRFSISH